MKVIPTINLSTDLEYIGLDTQFHWELVFTFEACFSKTKMQRTHVIFRPTQILDLQLITIKIRIKTEK